MQVHAIQNNTKFTGTLQVNKALNDFKAGLSDAQTKVFKEHIARMEKINDGRIFKFDNVEGTDTVAIFEKINHPMAKRWMTICQSPKEKAAWCFDELNNIYKNIILARFDEYVSKLDKMNK